MKKTKTAVATLTHTEILCYAIRQLESDISDVRAKASGKPDAEELLRAMLSRELQHLEQLYMLYKLETGTDYN